MPIGGRCSGLGLAWMMALAGCGDDSPPASEADTSSSGAAQTTSDSSEGPVTGADSTAEAPFVVSGDAFAFTLPGEPYGLIDGASISVLEQPGVTTTTDDQGHFVVEGLDRGVEATFVLEREGFPVAHTKTFTLPETDDLGQVTFQVPDDALFDLLAGVLMLEVDPGACQIVSTVTRVGKSIYDEGAHGEAEATVTIEPPVDAASGPIYFNAAVIPDPSLTETSEDGGVLFTNVPPGTYVLTAEKDGVEFESTTMQCAAGVLVNASPPYGLQALP